MKLIEFVDMLASRGKRVDSVTVRGKGATNNISDALRVPRNEDGTMGMQEPSLFAGIDPILDGEAGPSRPPRGADISEIPFDVGDYFQYNDSQHQVDLLSKRARNVTLTDDDSDEGGEASSSVPLQKRPRTDHNVPLMRDYVDDDEIEMLLAQGYFN